MKRYSIAFQAGVPVDIDCPGRFFTLLDSIAPVTVSLQRAGKQSEVLDSITAGFWADFGDEMFSRIRIVSPGNQTVAFMASMVKTGISEKESGFPIILAETGVNPVAAFSGQPGWVSGDPSGLAASALITSVFDLGPHWDQYGIVSLSILPVGPSSGFTSVQVSGADDASGWKANRAMNYAFSTANTRIYVSLTSAAACAQFHVRANGRFLALMMTNGDAVNAMGASKVFLSAYPNHGA